MGSVDRVDSGRHHFLGIQQLISLIKLGCEKLTFHPDMACVCFILRDCVCAMLFAAPVLYANLIVNLVTCILRHQQHSCPSGPEICSVTSRRLLSPSLWERQSRLPRLQPCLARARGRGCRRKWRAGSRSTLYHTDAGRPLLTGWPVHVTAEASQS